MQIAISLLMAAMSLLTTVQNSPNLSPEFVIKAENVAQMAISYAQNIINEQSSPTPQIATEPTQPIQTPETPLTFGSTSCIENPVLTISTTTGTHTSNSYDIKGSYTTGCQLDPSTKFYVSLNNNYNYSSGDLTKITDGNAMAVYGSLNDGTNPEWDFTVLDLPNSDSFSITVGSTTKNF